MVTLFNKTKKKFQQLSSEEEADRLVQNSEWVHVSPKRDYKKHLRKTKKQNKRK